MLLSQRHIDAFSALSLDRNPLHMDADYCRRTQFGRPVVFGMAVILAILGEWAKGRRFSLKSIKADFHKPVFPDEVLELKLQEEDGLVRVEVLKGTAPKLALVFQHAPAGQKEQQALQGPIVPLESAAETPQTALFQGPLQYALDPGSLPRFADIFRLSSDQLPLNQWNALCFFSYLVGMVCPGRQALFSAFSASFEAGSGAPHAYKLACKPRPSIRMHTLTGSGWALKSFTASAFERPVPKDDPIDTLDILPGKEFASKTVLVTGSSRGLGAVLTKTFALKGADVIVHYHRSKAEAERVFSEAQRHSPKPLLAGADLTDAPACAALADAVRKKYGKLDILVLSASPVIEARSFSEQTIEEFLSFARASLSAALTPARALLPLTRTIVAISSQYASAPRPLFSHYAAAKRALEGALESLAKEETEKRFLVFRLPRILTDQTNAPFSLEKLASPAAASSRIVQELSAPWDGPNFKTVELDLSD